MHSLEVIQHRNSIAQKRYDDETAGTPGACRVRKVLPNGAQVLNYLDIHGGYLVLAEFGGEYVTWKTDHDGNAFLGNYFQTYRGALRDFMARGQACKAI